MAFSTPGMKTTKNSSDGQVTSLPTIMAGGISLHAFLRHDM
jgi:hypothetical protein